MAPPLEPPSTIQPAQAGFRGVSSPPPVLSPFLHRVARQMQLDAELLSHRHNHRRAQHHMLELDAEALGYSQIPWQAQASWNMATQAVDAEELMPEEGVAGSRNGHAEHAEQAVPAVPAQHGHQQPQGQQDQARLAEQTSGTETSAAAETPQRQRAETSSVSPKQWRAVGHVQSAWLRRAQPPFQSSQHVSPGISQKTKHNRPGGTVSSSPGDLQQQHSPSSQQSFRQLSRDQQGSRLTPETVSSSAAMLPSSQQASNSVAGSSATCAADSGKTASHGARSADHGQQDALSGVSASWLTQSDRLDSLKPDFHLNEPTRMPSHSRRRSQHCSGQRAC